MNAFTDWSAKVQAG